MALIKCPECGKEISDKAVACPNCGCPISNIESKEIDRFVGVNGTLILYNNRVVLQSSGFRRMGAGDSIFPLNQIANVYVNKGTILTGGFIQILTAGQTNAPNLNAALKCGNAVTFAAGKKKKALEIRDKIYSLK